MASSVAFLVAAALICTAFFGGFIFGFSALQVLLEQDGVYADRCRSDGLSSPCAHQSEGLALVYSVGACAAVFFATVSGFIIDGIGPRWASCLCGMLLASGFALLAVAVSEEVFLPSAALFGAGGVLSFMGGFPLSFVVPQHCQPTLLAGISILFDASASSALICLQFYKHAGVGRLQLFVTYAAVAAVLQVVVFVGWRLNEHTFAAQLAQAKSGREKSVKSCNKNPENSANADCIAGALQLHPLPLKQQVRAWEFRFVTLFATLHMFQSNTYLGTNKLILERLGDASTGYVYTQIFGALLPVSVFGISLIGWGIKQLGFGMGFHVVTAMGAVVQAVSLIPSLPAQVPAFVFYSFYRAAFYSWISAYTAHTFGPRTVATIHGLAFIPGGILTLCVGPLVGFTNRYFDGNWQPVSAFMLALFLPLMLATESLRRRLARSPPQCDIRVVFIENCSAGSGGSEAGPLPQQWAENEGTQCKIVDVMPAIATSAMSATGFAMTSEIEAATTPGCPSTKLSL